MNFKTTYILFGAMLVMVAALVAALWYRGRSGERNPEQLFPSASSKDKDKLIKPDDVTKVTIQRKKPANSDLVFERVDDKTWKITQPRHLQAESSRVTSLVDSILNARVDKDTKVESRKKAGLDTPSRIISLYAEKKERTLKLTIGEVTPGMESSLAYVLSSDWPDKPLAVRKNDIDAALEELGYFRSKDLLGEGPSSDVRDIEISQGKKGTVQVRREKDRWVFVKPPHGDADIDTGFLTNVDNVKVDYRSDKDNDFVEEGVTDLAKIDKELLKSEQLRITVKRGEEGKQMTSATLVVLISKTIPDKKADKKPDADPKEKKDEGKYYAYTESGKTKDVVKVSAASIKPFLELLEHPEEKRNKNLVALEAFKTPDAIDVNNSYGVLEFRKPERGLWQLYRAGVAHPTDEAEVRKLIDSLTKTKVVTFPDVKRKKELGLEKPDIIVKIYSDSLAKDEGKEKSKKKVKDKKKDKEKGKEKEKDKTPALKKDAKPVTELRFGNREGDNVAVERIWGKESTIALIPASVLDQVKHRPLAYYEKRVPGFAAGMAVDAEVTKLELTRDGDVVEITREKPGTPWKFVRPTGIKGRNASEQGVRDILGDLNLLLVREVVAEKATSAELAKTYALTKPSYKAVVTVTKDKKDTTHTYEFGKEAAGKGYYARVSGKETIYLVDPRVVEAMKRELRDTTVFNFEPDKVTTLALTGWKLLLGKPTKRTFLYNKKDSKWTLKEDAEFTVDADKVSRLLGELAHLHADRFVTTRKGLKMAEGAFQVTITLEDKKILLITVGAEEGDKYYATSNQLKGDVFLVPKAPFEEPRKAPGYFHK